MSVENEKKTRRKKKEKKGMTSVISSLVRYEKYVTHILDLVSYEI